LTATRKGCVHRVTAEGDHWFSEEVTLPTISEKDHVQGVIAIPVFSAYIVVRNRSVDLLEFLTARRIFTFTSAERIQHRTFRISHSSRRHTQSGAAGLGCFKFAYISADTGACVIQTYLPKEEGDTICFFDETPQTNKHCCLWSEAKEVIRRISSPGTWELLPNGSIIGVRRVAAKPLYNGNGEANRGGLRHRAGRRSSNTAPARDKWEVWSLSQVEQEERYETSPLLDSSAGIGGASGAGLTHDLIISRLGPMVKVGTSSVAVGFGNLVKLISVGLERYRPADAGAMEKDMIHLSSARRRKGGAGARIRASSRGSGN